MRTNSTWCAAALTVLALTVLALTAASCGNGGVRGFSPEDTDYFLVASVPNGVTAAAATDIRCLSLGGTPFMSWDVDVDFLAVGGAGPVEPPSTLTRFQLSHFTVTYTNATVPGGPAPPPMTLALAGFVTDVPGTISVENWPIMTSAQKSSWPLNDPANLPNGGVTYTATITTFGAPVTNPNSLQSVALSVSLLVVDTCWDPDPLTGCPPSLLDPLNPSSFCF